MKRQIAYKILLILALLFIKVDFSYAQSREEPGDCYRLAVISSQDSVDIKRQWQATVDYLNKSVPEECFKLINVMPDYAEEILRDSLADFFIVSPVIYSQIEHYVPIDIYLSLERVFEGIVYSKSGSAVFVRENQKEINFFKDFKGKAVLALQTEDMRGWLAVKRELDVLGFKFKNFFKKIDFASNQREIIEAVKDGRYDIGILATGDLERNFSKIVGEKQLFKVILPSPQFRLQNNYEVPFKYSTHLYQDWVFGSRLNLPDEIVKKITSALLLFFNPNVTGDFDYVGWRPAFDYRDMHDAMWDLDLDLGRHNVWHLYRSVDLLWGTFSKQILAGITIVLLFLLFIGHGLFIKNKINRQQLLHIDQNYALREEGERRLEAILDAIPYAVMGFKNDAIVFANSAVKQVFGWDPESLIGKTAELFYLDSSYVSDLEEIYVALKKHKLFYREIPIKHKNGEISDCLVSIASVGKNENSVESVAVLIDISERKRQEELLHKLSRAIEQSPGGVAIATLDGKIEYVNSGLLDILGCARSHVVKADWSVLLAPNLQEEKKQLFFMVRSGESWQREFSNIRPDKTFYWGRITAAPLKDAKNQISHLVFMVEDITKRMATEENLVRTQKDVELMNQNLMESERALKNMLFDLEETHRQLKQAQTQLIQTEKLASIGQLAAGIAHEINNPVTYIMNNTSALERYVTSLARVFEVLKELDSEILGDDIKKISELWGRFKRARKEENVDFILTDITDVLKESREGLDRIKNIVADMKTFSRRDDVARVAVDINEVVEGVVNIVWSEIKYKVSVVKDFKPLPLIRCNSQQIGQVFINLLINAFQAIEEKGEICIKTFFKDEFVHVEIADNGRGIDPAILPLIFEPFFTTKKIGESTGLGLSISLEIVNRHQGKLEVKSELNRGTTFTVMLPV